MSTKGVGSQGDCYQGSQPRLKQDVIKEANKSVKKFNIFLKTKRGQKVLQQQRFSAKARKGKYDVSSNYDNEVTCYKCRKTGHIRKVCPLSKNKKDKDKKKVFKATWDETSGEDTENSSSDESVKMML